MLLTCGSITLSPLFTLHPHIKSYKAIFYLFSEQPNRYFTQKFINKRIYVCVSQVTSVVSHSLWPYGLQTARLLCPWQFFRQEYWSGLLCSPPGDLPDLGIKPTSLKSPALTGKFFTTNTTWKAQKESNIDSNIEFKKEMLLDLIKCYFIKSINIIWNMLFTVTVMKH